MKKKGFNIVFAFIFFFSLAICGCSFLFSSNTISKVEAASGNWSDNCSSAVITGGGTQNNPYIIDTAVKFAYIAWGINNGYTQWNTAFYKQTANIDLSAHYWNMMNTFAGYYDGQGYTLSGITNVDKTKTFALIETLSGTWINSGFVNVSISSTASGTSTDVYNIATLAINATESSTISGCFVSGSIYGKVGGPTRDCFVGGLVVNSSGIIKNCYSFADVTSSGSSGWSSASIRAAGIATNILAGTIESCYSVGTIRSIEGYYKTGGIVAYPYRGSVNNCAVLSKTCWSSAGGNTSRNNFFNYQLTENAKATATNCHVVSADTLKSNTNSPLDTWDFSDNTTN